MVQTRAFIVYQAARELSKACTIAIRYSAVRRQGKQDERYVSVEDIHNALRVATHVKYNLSG